MNIIIGALLLPLAVTLTSQTSITFVFDTTSSMSEVLFSTKKEARNIIKSVQAAEGSGRGFNYVLVPFKDPFVNEARRYDDVRDFLDHLNRLQVYGGGDCPEPVLTAISTAVDLSAPRSHIFVFTDADSRERRVQHRLRELIKLRDPKIYFVISGSCSTGTDPVYDELRDLTGGQLFDIRGKDIRESFRYLETVIRRDSNLIDPPLIEAIGAPQSLTYPPIAIKLVSDEPGWVYEYDTFSIVCESRFVGDLALRWNGRVIQEGSRDGRLAYEVKKAEKRHAGLYDCVTSRLSGAASEQISVRVHDRIVRQRTQQVTLQRGDSTVLNCPLEAVNGGECVLKWERNGVVLDVTSNMLPLSARELAVTSQVACFSYTRCSKVVDRIDFNVVTASPPTVDQVVIECQEYQAQVTLRCYVTANLLSSVQIMNDKRQVLLDTASDGNRSLIPLAGDRYEVVYQLTEQDLASECLICSASNYCGGDRKSVELGPYRAQAASRPPTHTTEKIRISEGQTLSLTCSDKEDRTTFVKWTKNRHHYPTTRRYIYVQQAVTSNAGTYECFVHRRGDLRLIHRTTFIVEVTSSCCSSWTDWTPCAGRCGQGTQSRNRTCSLKTCGGSGIEVQPCKLRPCSLRPPQVEWVSAPGEIAWNGDGNFQHETGVGYPNVVVNCTVGFTWDLLSNSCKDIDECAIKGTCRKRGCENTVGGFRCVECQKGYVGINNRCMDIDECVMGKHNCGQICNNVPGSFKCQCQQGFSLNPDGCTCRSASGIY